jgi:hypothetical protein
VINDHELLAALIRLIIGIVEREGLRGELGTPVTATFTGKKDGIRARRRAARLNLPPYGYLYATTAPYPPPRGYYPP